MGTLHGDVNDGKCTLFTRTTISGGIVSSVANVMEFIATKSGAGQERFANLLFSSLYCHPGEKLSFKKRALNSA